MFFLFYIYIYNKYIILLKGRDTTTYKIETIDYNSHY